MRCPAWSVCRRRARGAWWSRCGAGRFSPRKRAADLNLAAKRRACTQTRLPNRSPSRTAPPQRHTTARQRAMDLAGEHRRNRVQRRRKRRACLRATARDETTHRRRAQYVRRRVRRWMAGRSSGMTCTALLGDPHRRWSSPERRMSAICCTSPTQARVRPLAELP